MPPKKTPEMVTKLLKEAVSRKGQSAVARETGLTQPAISRYLRGIGEPTTDTFKKLSDYFGVSVSELRDEGYFVPAAFDDTYSAPFYLPERSYWRLLKMFHNVFSEDSTSDKNFFAVRSIYKLAVSLLDKIDTFWENLKTANSLSESGFISNTPIKEIEDYATYILEPIVLHAQNKGDEGGNDFYKQILTTLKDTNNEDYGKSLIVIYAKASIYKYLEMLETIDLNEVEFFLSIYKDNLTSDEVNIYNKRLTQNIDNEKKNRRNKENQ